jgi:hypothetical protein
MTYMNKIAGGLSLKLHVQPGAKKSEIADIHGDRLKIRLKAPPVDGKANKELVDFLSKLFDVPKRNIEISSGLASRQKTVKIIGITEDQLTQSTKIK